MNFFEPEQSIIERLKINMPELKEVFASDSLAALLENPPNVTPVAYVIYDGYRTTQDAATTQEAIPLHQGWMVLVVTRNVVGSGLVTSTRKEMAGEYIGRVIGLLLGFTPKGLFSGLKITDPPTKPIYGVGGVDFYPVSFSSKITVKKDRTIP